MQVPPRGGVSSFGWVDGLLSLVNRQCCLWAEPHFDTWGCCYFVQTCFAVQFCPQKNVESVHLLTLINLGYRGQLLVPSGVVSLLCISAQGAFILCRCFSVYGATLAVDQALYPPSPPPPGYMGGWVGPRVGGWLGG